MNHRKRTRGSLSEGTLWSVRFVMLLAVIATTMLALGALYYALVVSLI